MRRLTCVQSPSHTAVLAVAFAWLVLAPGQARAEEPRAPVAKAAKSFQDFCAQWLAKLDKRERFNRRNASKSGGSEYTAYGDVMIRCEAKPSGNDNNAIGRLVYHELRVRDASKKAGQAAQDVLERVEVMEIFRFDGTKWVW